MTISQAAKWLSERDNFIILTHKRPDGDTLCSAGALTCGLRSMGKTAYMFPNPEATDRYLKYVGKFYATEDYKPKYVVCVDTATRDMISKGADNYAANVDIVIDHHGSNSGYGAESCVDPDAAACGEMIFSVLRDMGAAIDAETAAMLYIAITTDTGCFQYTNTSSRTLEICAELVLAGAPNGALNKEFFRTKSRGVFQCEGEVMQGIQFYHEGRTAFAFVTQEMLRRNGIIEGDLEDVAAIPGQIEGVMVSFTLKEQSEGWYKVSCRTVPAVDSNAICARFGGGGHRCAGGCHMHGELDDIMNRLTAAAAEEMKL